MEPLRDASQWREASAPTAAITETPRSQKQAALADMLSAARKNLNDLSTQQQRPPPPAAPPSSSSHSSNSNEPNHHHPSNSHHHHSSRPPPPPPPPPGMRPEGSHATKPHKHKRPPPPPAPPANRPSNSHPSNHDAAVAAPNGFPFPQYATPPTPIATIATGLIQPTPVQATAPKSKPVPVSAPFVVPSVVPSSSSPLYQSLAGLTPATQSSGSTPTPRKQATSDLVNGNPNLSPPGYLASNASSGSSPFMASPLSSTSSPSTAGGRAGDPTDSDIPQPTMVERVYYRMPDGTVMDSEEFEKQFAQAGLDGLVVPDTSSSVGSSSVAGSTGASGSSSSRATSRGGYPSNTSYKYDLTTTPPMPGVAAYPGLSPGKLSAHFSENVSLGPSHADDLMSYRSIPTTASIRSSDCVSVTSQATSSAASAPTVSTTSTPHHHHHHHRHRVSKDKQINEVEPASAVVAATAVVMETPRAQEKLSSALVQPVQRTPRQRLSQDGNEGSRAVTVISPRLQVQSQQPSQQQHQIVQPIRHSSPAKQAIGSSSKSQTPRPQTVSAQAGSKAPPTSEAPMVLSTPQRNPSPSRRTSEPRQSVQQQTRVVSSPPPQTTSRTSRNPSPRIHLSIESTPTRESSSNNTRKTSRSADPRISKGTPRQQQQQQQSQDRQQIQKERRTHASTSNPTSVPQSSLALKHYLKPSMNAIDLSTSLSSSEAPRAAPPPPTTVQAPKMPYPIRQPSPKRTTAAEPPLAQNVASSSSNAPNRQSGAVGKPPHKPARRSHSAGAERSKESRALLAEKEKEAVVAAPLATAREAPAMTKPSPRSSKVPYVVSTPFEQPSPSHPRSRVPAPMKTDSDVPVAPQFRPTPGTRTFETLYARGVQWQISKEQIQEEERLKRQEQEAEEAAKICTFRPKINPKPVQSSCVPDNTPVFDRLAKQDLAHRQHQAKRAEEMHEKLETAECTFRPKIETNAEFGRPSDEKKTAAQRLFEDASRRKTKEPERPWAEVVHQPPPLSKEAQAKLVNRMMKDIEFREQNRVDLQQRMDDDARLQMVGNKERSAAPKGSKLVQRLYEDQDRRKAIAELHSRAQFEFEQEHTFRPDFASARGQVHLYPRSRSAGGAGGRSPSGNSQPNTASPGSSGRAHPMSPSFQGTSPYSSSYRSD